MASSSFIESKCFICSLTFDARTLAIHEKECLANLQNNLSIITQEVDNLIDVEVESTKSATSTGSNDASRKSIRCYICGNDFPTHFISLHEKKCKRNWDTGVTKNNNQLKKGASLGDISLSSTHDVIDGPTKHAPASSNNMKKAQSFANVALSNREPKQAWNARLRGGDDGSDVEKKSAIPCDNNKVVSKHRNKTSTKKKSRPVSAYASFSGHNVDQSSGLPHGHEVPIFYDDCNDLSNGFHDLRNSESVGTLTSSPVEKKAFMKTGTPRFTYCQYCMNQFSIHSILIHEKKCRMKIAKEITPKNKPRKKVTPNKKSVSVFELRYQEDDNNNDWSSLSQSNAVSSDMLDVIGSSDRMMSSASKTGPFPCKICGKLFGSKSLPIHFRQCEKRHQREDAVLKSNEKARLPRRRDASHRIHTSEISLDDAISDLKHTSIHNHDGTSEQTPVKHTPKQGKQNGTPHHDKSNNEVKLSSSQKKKPCGNNYVKCHFCNKYFGSASVIIHEVKCGVKMENSKEIPTPKNLNNSTPRKQFSSSARRLFNLQR
eukprot:gene9872-10882_t